MKRGRLSLSLLGAFFIWKESVFMSETELLVKEYSKNPLCNYEMQDPDVTRHEGNFICGDDVTVYLKIQEGKIAEFSYDGNPSTVSLAAASFLSEFLI